MRHESIWKGEALPLQLRVLRTWALLARAYPRDATYGGTRVLDRHREAGTDGAAPRHRAALL